MEVLGGNGHGDPQVGQNQLHRRVAVAGRLEVMNQPQFFFLAEEGIAADFCQIPPHRIVRSNGHWPSLLAAWLHFEVSFMTWMLIGALGIFIAEDFSLTATEKGLMVAVPLLGGSLFRVVVGILSDRFGPRRTGFVTMLAMSIP